MNKILKYSDKLKINKDTCIGFGKCARNCPMNNIEMIDNKAVGSDRCTLCYRCFNNCPRKAMTLLGKKVVQQTNIKKYIAKQMPIA